MPHDINKTILLRLAPGEILVKVHSAQLDKLSWKYSPDWVRQIWYIWMTD